MFAISYNGKYLKAFHDNSLGNDGISGLLPFSLKNYITFDQINDADQYVNNIRIKLSKIESTMGNTITLEKAQHILCNVKVSQLN
jgi:hypothetical protein